MTKQPNYSRYKPKKTASQRYWSGIRHAGQGVTSATGTRPVYDIGEKVPLTSPWIVKKLSGEDKKRIKKALRHENKLGHGARKRKHLPPRLKREAVMQEYARGTLHDSHGKIVKNPKQAEAIAYSEARRKK